MTDLTYGFRICGLVCCFQTHMIILLAKSDPAALAISFLGNDCIWLFSLCLSSLVKINDNFWKYLLWSAVLLVFLTIFHDFFYKHLSPHTHPNFISSCFAFCYACSGHRHWLLCVITLTAVVYFQWANLDFMEQNLLSVYYEVKEWSQWIQLAIFFVKDAEFKHHGPNWRL